jgi:hypothetical protein
MCPRLPLRLAAAGITAAALATPSTALAADAVYGGTSRDGDAIVLKSDAKFASLRSIAISWRATCDDGQWMPGGGSLTPAEPQPGFDPDPNELLVTRNAAGRFKGRQVAAQDVGSAVAVVTVDLEGKLKADRASGTTKVKVQLADKASGVATATCQTSQRWTASREPGVVYGGTTSQGSPVVLRLVAARKRVGDLFVSWFGACTPQGSWWSREHLGNFPVKRSGAFGNPFSDEVTRDDGGKVTYDYAVTGKLSRTAGTGSLRFKLSETDPAGAAGPACDSGGVTWKVKSA